MAVGIEYETPHRNSKAHGHGNISVRQHRLVETGEVLTPTGGKISKPDGTIQDIASIRVQRNDALEVITQNNGHPSEVLVLQKDEITNNRLHWRVGPVEVKLSWD